MLGKTHMAVGIAATLAVTRPDSVLEIIMAVSVGAVGSLISDLDVKSSIASKKANIIGVAMFVIIGLAVLADCILLHFKLMHTIWVHSSMLRILIGVLGFLAVCLFGKTQPHRSFMHSVLCLVLLDVALGLLYPPLVSYFTVGFLSHILIDSMNKKKIQLFYPNKKGFCLKWCSASGTVNRILCIGCSVLSVLEVILFTFQIIRK